MPLRSYGVLKGKAVARRREGGSGTPRYQVQVRDAAGVDYRIAVNVKSSVAPTDLRYLLEDDFRHPLTQTLTGLASGWNPLASAPGGASLDFIRGNLFDPALLRTLPPDVAGPDNDLADALDHQVTRAIGDVDATVYAFGERWGPETSIKDKVFGFLPGNGVHDIHMNQGNDPGHAGDDGVWQDGGLLLHFPSVDRWIAIFLAFQSQSWHTDDTTGHTITTKPTDPVVDTGAMRIVAAMANPIGGAPERETVLLLNASPAPIDLTGYKLTDRLKNASPVPPGPLAAGATRQTTLTPPTALGNSGGAITLLNAAGLKVAGVAYTADQAKQEGWTIVF